MPEVKYYDHRDDFGNPIILFHIKGMLPKPIPTKPTNLASDKLDTTKERLRQYGSPGISAAITSCTPQGIDDIAVDVNSRYMNASFPGGGTQVCDICLPITSIVGAPPNINDPNYLDHRLILNTVNPSQLWNFLLLYPLKGVFPGKVRNPFAEAARMVMDQRRSLEDRQLQRRPTRDSSFQDRRVFNFERLQAEDQAGAAPTPSTASAGSMAMETDSNGGGVLMLEGKPSPTQAGSQGVVERALMQVQRVIEAEGRRTGETDHTALSAQLDQIITDMLKDCGNASSSSDETEALTTIITLIERQRDIARRAALRQPWSTYEKLLTRMRIVLHRWENDIQHMAFSAFADA